MAIKTKSQASVAIINRMRDEASVDFQNAVPILTDNADNIKEIGKIIIDNPSLKNEALFWLVNRIGKTMIESATFKSPLAHFIRGDLEYGEMIEEIYVNIASPYQYSEDEAEEKIFKRVKADVKSAFSVVNSEIFYKTTLSDRVFRRAFLSADGVADLVTYIVNALYTSAQYDEFLMVKYLLAKRIVDGTVTIVPVNKINSQATSDSALTSFKAYSNNFEILSRDYNVMGVYNSCPKDRQYLITTNENDAFISVASLAYMFNMAQSDAGNKIVRIDSFSNFDVDRLSKLLGLDEGETPFTSDEFEALSNIEAVLLDENFYQIYYALNETGEVYNPEGLYTNCWLHRWTAYGSSPFANVVCFASGTNGVTGLSIDDSTLPVVTHGVKGSGNINATVTIEGLTPKYGGVIDWSVTSGNATIDVDGVLSWASDLTAGATITVVGKSRLNPTITDTATITVV